MIRIGIAYVDALNLGDTVIYDAARYLIERILKEHGIVDCELVPIDIGISAKTEEKLKHKIKSKHYARKIQKFSSNLQKQMLCSIKQWRATPKYEYFAENVKPKLNSVDLVVFVGGGMIKYNHQHFHYVINEVTQVAEERKIPVIFSSVGVEGYDENDAGCQLLKIAINRACVKSISTRDDLETLRQHYITNEKISTERVCDPALWAPECYGIKMADESNVIGLGVIRPEIFREYTGYVSTDFLHDMYFSLIKKLLDEGYQVQLFSNGLKKDHAFATDLMKKYPSLKKKGVSHKRPKSAVELVETVAQYKSYLAIRLHASIIGSTYGIPNVNLLWNEKQRMFGQQIGTEENYLTIESFDEDLIFNKLVTMERITIDPDYKNSVLINLDRELMKCIEGGYDR